MTVSRLYVLRSALFSILAATAPAFAPGAALAAGSCAVGVNCIANPSFTEVASPSNTMPAGWYTNIFGKSDASFSTSAGRLDSRSATVVVGEHGNPSDAKWVFEDVPVTGGQYFTFSDWYKSTAPSEVYAYFHGATEPFVRLATLPATQTPDTWTALNLPGFFIPHGATTMTVAHVLSGKGSLTTDDYALVLKTAPVFPQGLVSVTFDDAWQSVYDNAIPILDRAGLKSTQYINTEPVVISPGRYSTNMSVDDLLAMQANGHEIGAHSRTHRDLVEVVKDESGRRSEIDGSRTDLLGAGVTTVDTFAYPFGQYDETVSKVTGEHYAAARTTDAGYNTTDVDRLALKSELLLITTTPAEVQAWTEYALANKLWLILAIHRVEPKLVDCVTAVTNEPDLYCTDTATMQGIVDYLKTLPKGTVRTVHDIVSDESLWLSAPKVMEQEAPENENDEARAANAVPAGAVASPSSDL